MGDINRRCVIDTNILIYHLNDVLTDQAERRLEDALKHSSSISVITHIEVLGWKSHTSDSLKNTQELLACLHECPLNEEVVKTCITLRQTLSIKLPDAIIAATALHLEIPLMTRNREDFKHVPDLKIVNPFECPDNTSS